MPTIYHSGQSHHSSSLDCAITSRRTLARGYHASLRDRHKLKGLATEHAELRSSPFTSHQPPDSCQSLPCRASSYRTSLIEVAARTQEYPLWTGAFLDGLAMQYASATPCMEQSAISSITATALLAISSLSFPLPPHFHYLEGRQTGTIFLDVALHSTLRQPVILRALAR